MCRSIRNQQPVTNLFCYKRRRPTCLIGATQSTGEPIQRIVGTIVGRGFCSGRSPCSALNARTRLRRLLPAPFSDAASGPSGKRDLHTTIRAGIARVDANNSQRAPQYLIVHPEFPLRAKMEASAAATQVSSKADARPELGALGEVQQHALDVRFLPPPV